MASGDNLGVYTALSNQPLATSFATLDSRNNHLVLDFDAGSNETAIFGGVLPNHYGGGGITVTLMWMASTATSGGIKWRGAWERHQDESGDLDSDSFATVQNAAASIPPSVSGEVQYVDMVFSDAQIDGLLKNESYRLKIERNAIDLGDTMAGDAELLRVYVRET